MMNKESKVKVATLVIEKFLRNKNQDYNKLLVIKAGIFFNLKIKKDTSNNNKINKLSPWIYHKDTIIN